MRYDDYIKVRGEIDYEYNKDTGNLEEVEGSKATKYWANINKTPVEIVSLESGRGNKSKLTVIVDTEELRDVEELEVMTLGKSIIYKVEEYDEIKGKVYLLISEI